MGNETPALDPHEAVEAKFAHINSYPGKFGAATVEIAHLQEKLAKAKADLETIAKSTQWSGRRCRDYADAALDQLTRGW